ncbi:MAG: site-specific integrase [Pirellulales bacterium]|nr:site-specific integrase [Pirellulales bacterium]
MAIRKLDTFDVASRGPAAAPEPRTALRLFVPDRVDGSLPPLAASQGRLSPAMSLSEFFDGYVWPVLMRPRDTSARTLAEYRRSLGYWVEFTGDPPLGAVSQALCVELLAGLQKCPGRPSRGNETLARNTIRKHCTQLQYLLDLAGPRSRANRMAATKKGLFGLDEDGLPNEPPYLVRSPAERNEVDEVFEVEEIHAWLEACERARVPRDLGVAPAAWWRALIRYLYNTGVRLGTAMAIRWTWHERDERGRLWLKVPKTEIKGHAQKSFYVNAEAADAIESIRTAREIVFAWPHHPRWLQAVRVRLQAAAGLPPHRRFGFHALRRAMCTEAAEMNALVAQKQAGHTAIAMTRDKYVNKRVVAATMERLPQPKRRRTKDDDPDQKKLF